MGIGGYAYDESRDVRLRRWMLFVDGENFALRAREFSEKNGITITPGAHYMESVFIWLPNRTATRSILDNKTIHIPLQSNAIRAYYYASVAGDDQKLTSVKESLWNIGFNPAVFKKTRQEDKAKGVDIALSKDMLSHAYLGNYEVAVLIAGDGDYVPLIEEIKRLGKVVYVVFFEKNGLNNALRLATDGFFPIDETFKQAWSK